ncbi:hypothetical protein ACW9YV_10960 [Paraburkholderia strydomiana]
MQTNLFSQFGLANKICSSLGASALNRPNRARSTDITYIRLARGFAYLVSKGTTALTGGKRLTEMGPNCYAPTVVAPVSNEMLVTCEQTFGP